MAPGRILPYVFIMHTAYRPAERLGSLLNGYIREYRSVTDVISSYATKSGSSFLLPVHGKGRVKATPH